MIRDRVAHDLVERAHHAPQVLPGQPGLAAQVRLQIGHHQRPGDPLARDVGEHQTYLAAAQLEEVVVVAADGARLHAVAGAVECSKLRDAARQEPRLHFLRELQLDRRAALGLQALGDLLGETDVFQSQRRLARHR